jgi:VWFA-related protein
MMDQTHALHSFEIGDQTIRALSLLIAASVLLAESSAAPMQKKAGEQDRPVQLKTELVELRVVVTDRRGQIIDGLNKQDFELRENDRPREISFFSLERVGAEANLQPRPANTPEPKPEGRVHTSSPGRTLLLFVDTVNLSISSLGWAKQALRRFVAEHLTERDVVGLVTTDGSLGLLEQFTTDRQMLRHAIDMLRIRPQASNSYFTPYIAGMVRRGDRDAIDVAIGILQAEEHITGPRQFLEQMAQSRASQVLAEAGYRRRVTLLTLAAAAKRMAEMPGQRLIAYVSDGFTMMDESGTADTGDLLEAISRAVRSGVVIYSLDAKGLQPPPLFDASRPGLGSDPRTWSRISFYLSASEHDEENGMNALAKDTGGEAFFNSNDLSGALKKVLDYNQTYYVLAYYPVGDGDKKSFRRIAIKVKDHPDYVVRAQKGYLAADLFSPKKESEARTPQQRLLQAIVSPLPLTGIPVAASAGAIETDADKAQVTFSLLIDAAALQYREQDGRYLFDLQVTTVVYDSRGKPVDTSADDVHGNLLPERLELSKRVGYRYGRRITLKPGLYQIRAGVRDPATDRIGTSAAWIEVPNLKRKRLMMSSVFLADTSRLATTAEAGAPGRNVARVSNGVSFYAADATLTYLFKLYTESRPVSADEVMIQSEFFQGGKSFSQTPWQPISPRVVGNDSKGIEISGQYKLNGLSPGIYELRVTVKDPKSNQTAQQAVTFGIAH